MTKCVNGGNNNVAMVKPILLWQNLDDQITRYVFVPKLGTFWRLSSTNYNMSILELNQNWQKQHSCSIGQLMRHFCQKCNKELVLGIENVALMRYGAGDCAIVVSIKRAFK